MTNEQHMLAAQQETNTKLAEIIAILRANTETRHIAKCAWCGNPLRFDCSIQGGDGKLYCSVACHHHDTAQLSTPN